MLPASFHDFRLSAKCALRACECAAKKTGAVSLFRYFSLKLRSEVSGSDCCEAIGGPEHASSRGGFCYD